MSRGFPVTQKMRAERKKAAMERQARHDAKTLEEKIEEQLKYNPNVVVDFETNIANGAKKELRKLLLARAKVQAHIAGIKSQVLNDTIERHGARAKTQSTSVIDFAVEEKLVPSKSVFRAFVMSKKVTVNGQPITDVNPKLVLKNGDIVTIGTKSGTVKGVK